MDGRSPAGGHLSKSQDRVALDSWEEITGVLKSLEGGDQLVVELSIGTLVFGWGHPTAERIYTQLSGKEGAVVSVLRTDLVRDPVRVNVTDDS